VRTDCQGRGVGRKLIGFGIEALMKDGVELALTYGDPAFYSTIGFQVVKETVVPAPMPFRYPQGWLAQSLTGDEIEPTAGTSHIVWQRSTGRSTGREIRAEKRCILERTLIREC